MAATLRDLTVRRYKQCSYLLSYCPPPPTITQDTSAVHRSEIAARSLSRLGVHRHRLVQGTVDPDATHQGAAADFAVAFSTLQTRLAAAAPLNLNKYGDLNQNAVAKLGFCRHGGRVKVISVFSDAPTLLTQPEATPVCDCILTITNDSTSDFYF